MPIYYLDTSATVKRYLTDEKGADFMEVLIEGLMTGETLCFSSFGILEFQAAVMRQTRAIHLIEEAMRKFDGDMSEMYRIIPLNDGIVYQAMDIVESYKLRAGDAVHLATALSVAADADGEQQVFMVSSDVELLAAAGAAGIGAIDPQADGAMDRLLGIRTE